MIIRKKQGMNNLTKNNFYRLFHYNNKYAIALSCVIPSRQYFIVPKNPEYD